MAGTMNAILWDGGEYPESLSLAEYPLPHPPPAWVRIRVRAVGICGSDLHMLTGDTKYLVPKNNFPAILGHENSGVVDILGEGVSSVILGDRVAIEPLHPCSVYGNSCANCNNGQYSRCESGVNYVGMPLREMITGGYVEFVIVRHSRLFPIPDHVSFEDAAILDTLAVEIHIISIGDPEIGQSVVLLGCGIVGLEMIQVLRVRGITNIIGVAKYDYQAAVARRLGAKRTIVLKEGVDPANAVLKLTGGKGVDQLYEWVGGNTDAVAQGLAMCAKGGKLIMIGGASRPRPIDLQQMILQETSIPPCKAYSRIGVVREYQIALDLLITGLVDHKSLFTHSYRIDEYRRAFETALSKEQEEVIKVVLVRD
jgi:L-iditol 2-dehydrogenase